ncbi:uncharacterized protein LOC110019225 isoform X1 [Phalaenopsis equestris]|uniref:uncharacterized protein LOC110019225 isoform X1 n=1 Tax=Phalaenopsis equestris TaxID=78828 RepID=UPI0009E2D91D|nr:uncharacterized protein LOC110019225 isoform X1 [Phalaenopsis equestris]XP_020572468.1 uncharacterized protein LOC110019225 isoform X1 [Phalaenopsis equestris]
MDDYRRFRSIPDDRKFCSVCSMLHYPFCPPPPAFTGDSLRCRPPDFCPPLFDRPLYNSSQSSGVELFRPPSYRPIFLQEEAIDQESFRKRMRVEDPEIRVFPYFQPLNLGLSVDDERRLNLIRDHGREGSTLMHDERHWNNNSDYRIDRDDRDPLQKHFGGGGIDHGLSESEVYHRDGRYQAKVYEGYPNQPICNSNREDRRDFNRMEFGPDRRVSFDAQIGGGFSYGLNAHLDRNSQISRFRGPNEILTGSQNFGSVVPGESCLKDSWRPSKDYETSGVGNFHDQQQTPYSTNNGHNALRVGNFHDRQQAHPMMSSYPLLPKQPSHLHNDDYLTAPYHQDHATQSYMESKSEFYKQQGEIMGNCLDHRRPISVQFQIPSDPQTYPAVEQLGAHANKHAGYTPTVVEVNHAMRTSMPEHGHTSQAYPPLPLQPPFPDANHVIGTSMPDNGHTSQAYPPVPLQPLFPIQTESSISSLQPSSSSLATISIVGPVQANSSAKRLLSVYGSQTLSQGEFYSDPPVQASNGLASEVVERVTWQKRYEILRLRMVEMRLESMQWMITS